MAKNYKTPGIYIEEISKFPPSIAAVETSIPAFLGYTEKAEREADDDLILKPARISSMTEYRDYFGGPQSEEGIVVTISEKSDNNGLPTDIKAVAELPEAVMSKHLMYYSVQMFFYNGEGACWIVSVGKYKSLGTPLSETELSKGLNSIVTEDEPALIVFPEAQNLNIDDFKTLHEAALIQCETLKDRFVIMDLHGDTVSVNDPGANLLNAVTNFRTNGIGIKHLKFGAAYAPNVEADIDYEYDETKTDVFIVVNGNTTAPVKMNTLKAIDSLKYQIARNAIADLPCKLPPSGAVAGIYASVDRNRGVWTAPANISLNAILRPTIKITNVEQDQMNVDANEGKSVNAIRLFAGKGTLIWGARTLAGNDNEWRYISVRRFFNFVEESVKKGTALFVFEPNDADTWVKVRTMIENFLITLWRQGALQGAKPEHAFYVSVGLGKTMTSIDIREGRMIIEIGMAAVRTAEFIILKFSHKMAKS